MARAAPDPRTGASHPGFRTGTLRFVDPGSIVASLGSEYLPDVTNRVAGVKGHLLRLPTFGLRLGLAENAEFQVLWPAYNRLRVNSQRDPPPLGRKLHRTTRDFGDVTLATLIRLHGGRNRWPGFGIRFAAKLPNSNEKLAIGDNTTDVFASVLVSSAITPGLTIYGDFGLGILTEPTATFSQNDVLTYGLMSDWRVRGTLHAVAEAAGRIATHRGGPGTESRGEVRAGIAAATRPVSWNAYLIHGLTRLDSRGLGVGVNVAYARSIVKQRPVAAAGHR